MILRTRPSIFLALVCVFLPGCTVQPIRSPSTPMDSTPLPPSPLAVEIPPEIDPQLLAAWQTYKRTNKAPTITRAGIVRYPYQDGIVLRCKVMALVDIEFGEGEEIGNVVIGDETLWKGQKSTSGTGSNKRAHLAVSPEEQGARTTILIYTNHRTYSFFLREGNSEIIRVGFWHPSEVEQQISARNTALARAQQQGQQRPRNGGYHIDGSAAWAPWDVFDDGERTYILFPEEVRTSEMPVLYITERDREELTNYNISWPYLIVGRKFTRAALLLGVGREQQRVSIWR